MAVSANVTVNPKTKRGQESWGYIWMLLAFVVGLEAAIIAFMASLAFPRNALVFVVVVALTVWWFLQSGWLHNQLFRFKDWYESKLR